MKQWCDFVGGQMWLDPDDGSFEALMATSRWEHRKVALLQKYLQDGMTFIDAGAHQGYFSLIAAHQGARVIAIEPERETNFSALCDNFAHNHDVMFECWPVALWNDDGTATLHTGYNTATHSLITEYDDTSIRVQTKTLDSIVNRRAVHVVKIDVEGADYEVLEGARRTLEYAESMVILMDLHPELGVNNRKVGELLTAYGFRLFDIRSDNAPIDFIHPTMVELLAVKGAA